MSKSPNVTKWACMGQATHSYKWIQVSLRVKFTLSGNMLLQVQTAQAVASLIDGFALHWLGLLPVICSIVW